MERELKRFDIVLVDFGSNTIGSEQGGKRPAIIIQNDVGNHFSTTTIVFPLTTQLKNVNQPTHTILKKGGNGLSEDSMVLGEAIRQISKQRIIKYIGTVDDEEQMTEIKKVYNANFGF